MRRNLGWTGKLYDKFDFVFYNLTPDRAKTLKLANSQRNSTKACVKRKRSGPLTTTIGDFSKSLALYRDETYFLCKIYPYLIIVQRWQITKGLRVKIGNECYRRTLGKNFNYLKQAHMIKSVSTIKVSKTRLEFCII